MVIGEMESGKFIIFFTVVVEGFKEFAAPVTAKLVENWKTV